MSRTEIFDELDTQGSLVELDHAQADALRASGLVEVRPERDQWRLLPRRVGAVRIDDLQVQVTPKDKVGLDRLLFLLGYAKDPGFLPTEVWADQEPSLWAALAESLARLGERATGAGVLQGYLTVEEAMKTVRGRIRIGDQIARRPGFLVPVEVTYDEFTANIAENQILRTAIRRMLAVPRLDQAVGARLAHLDGRLADVSVLRHGAPVPKWQPSRLNERYHAALRLAEIILAHASAEVGDGDIQVAAFVVDMAKVYEDFLGTALTEALRQYPGVTKVQYSDRLDEAGDIRMAVDIVHTVAGKPHLVFDAKYKAASSDGTYPNADHYQTLAYCTALSVPTGWLVYAGGPKPKTHKVRNTDIAIVQYPLDLSVTPTELLEQIRGLAQQAWQAAQQSDPNSSTLYAV